MKVNLIYSDDCPHCKDVLKALEAQGGIPDKEITLVELTTDQGLELLTKLEFDSVPAVSTKDNIKCEIKYVNDKVDILCPGNS